MFDIWKHANEITNHLTEGLYILEFQYGGTNFSEMPETTAKTSISDAWILAQLFGGNHVRSMAMSLAWLCINGLRLQDGLFAIYRSADRNERLSIALEDAWLDAEDLRGFFGYYERNQKPEGYRSVYF